METEHEEVFIGAACSNNGRADALAGFRVFFNTDDERNTCTFGIPGRQTNNAAHLHGLVCAIRLCSKTKRVVMKTCSKLTADGVLRLPSWKQRGWRKLNGKRLVNLDLWKRIDQELIRFPMPVHVVHVPQHVAIRGNNATQYFEFRSKLRDMRKRTHIPSQATQSAPATSIPFTPDTHAASVPSQATRSAPAVSIPVSSVVHDDVTNLYTDDILDSHCSPTILIPIPQTSGLHTLHAPSTHIVTDGASQSPHQTFHACPHHMSVHSTSTE